MSKKDGGPAFPHSFIKGDETGEIGVYHTGLTKREWFAGMVLQGLMSNPMLDVRDGRVSLDIIVSSYALADAMISEGEKE